jgi:hypothetical protein
MSLACGLFVTAGLSLVALPPAASQTTTFEDILFVRGDQAMRVLGRDIDDHTGAALAIGDVNGDDIEDILVGTLRSGGPGGREKAGKVSVILGASDLPADLPIEEAPRTFFGATTEARLGHAVAVGDLNRDGIGDIVMGAPEARAPAGGEGAVYVFFGSEPLPGPPNADLRSVPPDLTIWGDEQGGRLGNTIAVGDFNGDGHDELAIAGPRQGDRAGTRDAGRVYVIFHDPTLGPNSEITARAFGPSASSVMEIRGAHAEDLLGQALAAGDINGDGIDDLLMGMTLTRFVESTLHGEVLVLLGGAEHTPGVVLNLANPANIDVRIIGPATGDKFGVGLSVANINGDGADDILIGAAKGHFTAGFVTGRAYALLGRAYLPGTLIDLRADPADVTLVGPHDTAELGLTLTGADLNNDGFDDWIVGAPRADRTGQAYRVPGRADWPVRGFPGALTMGARPGDRAGEAIAAGDVNGDGIADLVVASPEFDGTGNAEPQIGAVYVVFGGEGSVDPVPCVDGDGDGLSAQGRTCGPIDCDDNNPAIGICVMPGCDGQDDDGDGWPTAPNSRCPIADCDDKNPNVNPGAQENCTNGKDDNCDTAPDGADVACGGPGPGGPPPPPPPEPPPPEDCTNCVDDDADTLRDLLDPDCVKPVLGLKGKIIRRSEKTPNLAKRVLIRTTLPDDALMTGVQPNAETTAPSLLVGLALTKQFQLCVSVEEVKHKKTTMVFRSLTPDIKLKLKRKKNGSMRVKYKQKGELELPNADPDALHFGIYNAPMQSYAGFSPLRKKNGKALITVRASER